MLTINDKHIILGSIGGGGGSAPVLPDGWDSGWLAPPEITSTTVNGKTDVCGLVCNVLDIGNRNYFSCIASGAYTVSVYTDATATTLISTQNVASGTQADWQIDYAACTYQLNTDTRQAWVEIVPQSGQALTAIGFYTNHPAETNPNSASSIVGVLGVLPNLTAATNMFSSCFALQSVNLTNLPNLTDATSMFSSCFALQSVNLTNLPVLTTTTNMFGSCYALQSVNLTNLPNLTDATSMFFYCLALQSVNLTNLPVLTNTTNMFFYCLALQSVNLPSLPNLTDATSMFSSCYALQSVNLTNLPNLTNATSMFGTTVESTCLRSLRRLVMPDITVGFILQYSAMQAQELNTLFTSLGAANGAQTIDIRNQPGSLTCNVSIATAKGYTVLTT